MRWPNRAARLCTRELGIRFGKHVGDVNDTTVEDSAPGYEVTDVAGRRSSADGAGSRSVVRDEPEGVAGPLGTIDRVVRIAQPRCALRHCIQHRLQIGRRAADHAQDLAGRGLLLEGLRHVPPGSLQLSGESRILDGRREMEREDRKQMQAVADHRGSPILVVGHEQAERAAAGDDGDHDKAVRAKRFDRRVRRLQPRLGRERMGFVDEDRCLPTIGLGHRAGVGKRDLHTLAERQPVRLRQPRARYVDQPIGFGRDGPDEEAVDASDFSSGFQHMRKLLLERERLLQGSGQQEKSLDTGCRLLELVAIGLGSSAAAMSASSRRHCCSPIVHRWLYGILQTAE